jgi:hypothetical protein
MKREDIEKAAAIYTAQAEDSDYAEVRDVKQAFVSGAEWMEKHFSWISVEERLPESKEKVLVLNRMKHHDKYFVSENIYINGIWRRNRQCITKKLRGCLFLLLMKY